MREPDAAVERLLTVSEVAERPQATVSTVRRAIASGRLRASLPLGRRVGWRISETALQQWLEDHERPV